MIDATLSNRPSDLQQLRSLLKKYHEMNETQKDIMENAVLEIYSMFDLDPAEYQFDFRFNRK